MRSRPVRRPIQFFHLPVPKPRTDDTYFAPLGSTNRGGPKFADSAVERRGFEPSVPPAMAARESMALTNSGLIQLNFFC
jgi:hypothetical protein